MSLDDCSVCDLVLDIAGILRETVVQVISYTILHKITLLFKKRLL